MARALCLCAVSVVLFACVSVGATTILVPDHQPTIQAGVNAASDGDTVIVACDTYYEHDITISNSIYLRSETGQPDCVTIDAQGLGRVFFCGVMSGTIEGFTITGGWVAGNGGGIECAEAFPLLRNLIIKGNHAGNRGGGLYCFDCGPTVEYCLFTGNTAAKGGGLSCDDWSSPTLTNVTFYGNGAPEGGAIHCYWTLRGDVELHAHLLRRVREHGRELRRLHRWSEWDERESRPQSHVL